MRKIQPRRILTYNRKNGLNSFQQQSIIDFEYNSNIQFFLLGPFRSIVRSFSFQFTTLFSICQLNVQSARLRFWSIMLMVGSRVAHKPAVKRE